MKEGRAIRPNPGALRMLTYIPQALVPRAPLVVVLHGCAQGGEGHAVHAGWLVLADRLGFAVLAPEQIPANNINRCFNWYEPGETVRGAGEAASIRAMVDRCLAEHDLDPGRVFVTGLSAGGAMTAVMLATYPDVFEGGAVIAGLPYGAANSVQEGLSLMRSPPAMSATSLGDLVRRAAPGAKSYPKLSVWHGDADRTVDHRNGDALARQWASFHGLCGEPDEVEELHGRLRSTWRSPSGEAVVELNMVRGLGHGTPLAAMGDEGVGSPAPYMVEAGVSSSLEVARFWGLAPAFVTPDAGRRERPMSGGSPPAPATASRVGASVMAAVSSHVPRNVQSTIERALRGAGLMD